MTTELFPDLNKLKSSWTKYDIVKIIDIVYNNQVEAYLRGEKSIDKPTLKSVLGISSGSEIPSYWTDIHEYPEQVKLFTLVAALFTHHDNIRDFANLFSTADMGGRFIVEPGSKRHTNIRSALVESEASLRRYRRETGVPYNFAKLYLSGEVGVLFKKVLINRLIKIGWNDSQDFYKTCLHFDFHKTLGLTKDEFHSWLEGTALKPRYKSVEKIDEKLKIYKSVNAVKVKQWLNEWNSVDFDSPTRSKPEAHFFLFKLDARMLRRLADVHRRKASGLRKNDASIQRGRTDSRVDEIERYIRGGFPWSTLNEQQRENPEFDSLKMPGIMPTAIIANILTPNSKRNHLELRPEDSIVIEDSGNDTCKLVLPDTVFEDSWNPSLFPIEIIDGQHRLWAFDENIELNGNYELPVVAYYNLDLTWQAYLFYTINIKPTKINTSLGYDLYPLLRTQEWLEQSKDGLKIYRETRAQEMVEALWLYPDSPWRNRINMVGDKGGALISQAAFVRAITTSFLKRADSKSNSVGGLFGEALTKKQNQVLYWNRTQQAAFLIFLWMEIEEAVKKTDREWAVALRKEGEVVDSKFDKAFAGKNSLLSRDQGVTGILGFANDLFYTLANESDIDLNSFSWNDDLDEKQMENMGIAIAINDFKYSDQLQSYVKQFAITICDFDWRTSSSEFSNDVDKSRQMALKGSSGYSTIRKELKKLFVDNGNELSVIADKLYS